MIIMEVNDLYKCYGNNIAVDELSFSVEKGEIFGFIGQNGAGKTTTIRILMNILKKDRGGVSLFSQEINDSLKDRIGYLPEERGLYTKSKVMKVIIYFALLKGMGKKDAFVRTEELLRRFNLYDQRNKRIGELSKGMSQLVQFIVAIIHSPDILILDEPFSGLDPSNADFIKGVIQELKKEGKTIFFSAHNMHDVEELCDRILMIKDGRAVLYGSLSEIKDRYRDEERFNLKTKGDLKGLSEIADIEEVSDYSVLRLKEGKVLQDIITWIYKNNVDVVLFELNTPSLNEIFLEIAGDNGE